MGRHKDGDKMNTVISLIAGGLSGLIGAMGMGGGAVLIIYLTVFKNTKRFKAQGINLLFFIPIAIAAVIIYAKNKVIEWKTVIIMGISGLLGAVLGIFAADALGTRFISKLFGAALILLGAKEIFTGIKTVLAKHKNKCYNKSE